MLEELEPSASIVHYLGAFDLFSTCFFRLGLFLVLFPHHDGHIYPDHNCVHDYEHDHHPAESHQRNPASTSLKLRGKRGTYHTQHTVISHLIYISRCSADREKRVSHRPPQNRSLPQRPSHGTRASPSVDLPLLPLRAVDHPTLAPLRAWWTLLESG